MLHSTKILLVDDNEFIRKSLKRLLRSMGFDSVETAENGKEALEMLDAGAFGCVISDYNMPVMNGYELLVEIREHRARDTPFVLMSSQIDDALMTAAFQADANACLAKESITPELLGEIFQKI